MGEDYKTLGDYSRATILGLNTRVIEKNGVNICATGTYKEIWITDYTNHIGGGIQADRITYSGNEKLFS